MTRQSVRAQIRFALEQLKAKNQHHGFEDVCREFARTRICRNILPATGPVSSGGDHGRDFETFKTYLGSDLELNNTNAFEGVSDQGNMFFACSTQKGMVRKIKSDVESIFSYSDDRKPIVYFCVEDMPVAKRHELKKWCLQTYEVELDIHDGQSLAENLSDPQVFWIAEEYLHIPADIYPVHVHDDEAYIAYKDRWISERLQPQNYADFYQIKYGLRRATFNSNLKPDLSGWLSCMEQLEKGSILDLKRKVQYEVCVAALRGQNNLNAYKAFVERYFSSLVEVDGLEDLSDACVLLSYCTSAKLIGEFEVEAKYLYTVTNQLINIVDGRLEIATSPNHKCQLFSIKAHTCMLSFVKEDGSHSDVDGAFKYWGELVGLADQAPFYPLEQLSDVFKRLIPLIGEDERFLTITDKLDQLIAKRSGAHAAADRCRDRAVAYYKADQILLAIDHLHRAKINWFSAETLPGSLLALRNLAQCYEELGLSYAAKYCAYSSFYIAFDSQRDDLREVASQSLFQASKITYNLGEWYSFFVLMKPTLMTHNLFDHDPQNPSEHDSIKAVYQSTTMIGGLTKHCWPHVHKLIMEVYNDWPMNDYDRAELNGLMDIDLGFSKAGSMDIFWNKTQGQFKGKPFNDLGVRRTIQWRALGIDWKVNFENDYDTTAVTEEFVAIFQLILADIARDDLQLLPVVVKLDLSISESDEFHMSEAPDNECFEWTLEVTRYKQAKMDGLDARFQNVFSHVVAILESCTTLTPESYREIIESAFDRGLLNKAFFAIPYPKLFNALFDQDDFGSEVRTSVEAIEEERNFGLVEHEALVWKSGDGLTYSKGEAIMRVKNRYDALSGVMKIIWPKIQSSKRHMPFFQALHEEGYRDWHIALIVGNAVANYIAIANGIVPNSFESQAAYGEAYNRVMWEVIDGKQNRKLERLDIEDIDSEIFSVQEKFSLVLLMQAWGLCCLSQTPKTQAVKKLLIERYKIFETDVKHQALFPVKLSKHLDELE